jgi:putative transposase
MAPVRASVVKIPKNYQWSSYKANAQGQDAQVKITQHESYSLLEPWIDKNNKEIQEKYKQLFRGQQNDKELQQIRKAIKSSLIYGSKEFQKNL